MRGEQPGAGAISAWHPLFLEQPVPATRYLAIPVAMAVAVAFEGLVVWLVRRNVRK
jgi:hypothetical protein